MRYSGAGTGVVWRLALLFALGAIAYLGYRVHQLEQLALPLQEGPPKAPLVVPKGELSDIERSTVDLFRRASRSVVHITTLDVQADPFQLTVLEVPKGTGSGFIWDRTGHIVTNLHVLQGARKARVSLADRSLWPAKLVGYSARNDLAVLRVAGAGTRGPPLPIGSSRDLEVGQGVIAIGSPFGLDYTLSTGVISGLGREIPGRGGLPIRDAIQTDAAINPGNSGGPLLDTGGRLIGVNTAILSPSGASAGIGFAVPVDTVARVVPQLIRYGREVRSIIGVELAADEVTRRLGLRGALILRVPAGSPAAEAGLVGTRRDGQGGEIALGDLIVGLDDQRIASTHDLHVALDTKRPGDRVTLEVARGGQRLQVQLPLSANVPEAQAEAQGRP